MSMLIAAIVQVSSPGAAEVIDLTLPPPCEARRAEAGEIVVCGRRSDELGPYRLPTLPPRGSEIPEAEMAIGKGIKIAGETESADVGGFPSKRVMVRLKIKF